LVDRADRHGDVSVEGSADGIDPAIVSSVDLRHVTVTRQRHGVRVVIRLKEVLPARGRWVQEVGISLFPPSWIAAPDWFFLASATPQHLGSAGAMLVEFAEDQAEVPNPEEDEVFCHLAASKGAKIVRLVIPDRCLPPDSGELIVVSGLHDKRGETPMIIQDELVVGGLVDLQPGR
jgi:hypothetical protein